MLSTENTYRGDSADLGSSTESGQRDVRHQKVAIRTATGRTTLSVRKACQDYIGNTYNPKPYDCHFEIAEPRNCDVVEFQNEESVSSSVTKPLERMSTDVSSMKEVAYEYVPMDDRQECLSVSNLATDNFENKFLTVSHDCFINSGLLKPTGRSQHSAGEGISCDEQIYSIKVQNHMNSNSTVTEPEPTSQTTHHCCALIANEMAYIRKQLSDIEIKQANLMHQLQVFHTCDPRF